jgi:hypothetical protein
MSGSITRKTSVVALLMISLCSATPARSENPQPVREATIQPETKARLILQSQINSKLSEADDVITATLAEPVYVEGRLVLPRGVEFHGRLIKVSPAKRGQRSSNMTIEFERVITPSGEVPISAQVTAIDDWDKEETIKADGEGKLKGGHRGEKTIENMRKGSHLGFSGSIVGIALGGAFGASGRQVLGIGGAGVAAGMIAGLLLTKGSEIRVSPGTILRIKFLKPVTLTSDNAFQRAPRLNQ